MTHVIRFRQVDRQIFLDIKSGKKSVETRAASSKYATITADDSLKRFTTVILATKKKLRNLA